MAENNSEQIRQMDVGNDGSCRSAVDIITLCESLIRLKSSKENSRWIALGRYVMYYLEGHYSYLIYIGQHNQNRNCFGITRIFERFARYDIHVKNACSYVLTYSRNEIDYMHYQNCII
jgi:hypothetical protein